MFSMFVLWMVVFLGINIYYGMKANKGEVFDLPVIGEFVRKQGW